MKLELEHNKVRLSELKPGETFMYGDRFFMKCCLPLNSVIHFSTNSYIISDTTEGREVLVDLGSGVYKTMPSNELVTPVVLENSKVLFGR